MGFTAEGAEIAEKNKKWKESFAFFALSAVKKRYVSYQADGV